MNRFRTDPKRDCANTPITSAYKSAKICTFAAFGLDWNLKETLRNDSQFITHAEDNIFILMNTNPSL